MNTNNQTDGSRPGLSNEQRRKMKKYAVFTLMGIICAGCIWFIFAPSSDGKARQEAQAGFNTEIPDPKSEGLIGDKRDAYEQEQVKRKQEEKMQSLQDFSSLLGEGGKRQPDDIALLPGDASPSVFSKGEGTSRSRAQSSIQTSAQTYRDMNRTLGNFYEKPKADPEKEAMKQKLEELEARMQEKESARSSVDEQLALMEKSYEMAAKYMPQAQNQPEPPSNNPNSLKSRIENYGKDNSSKNGKTKISPVRQIQKHTVSSLAQSISNEDLFRMYDQPRNTGFHTVGRETGVSEKNTISAVIHDGQTLIDGQTTRLRLTEPLMAGTMLIPENTILTGIAKIQGERLDILVSSIEYQGTIIPVEMVTYDTDGQKGVHIPGSLELDAAKEIVANMGNSVGTSFTMTQSAGAQITSDLGKGAIQGVSAYMQKKIKQVKVTLKAGYKVMLMPKAD